MQPGTGPNETSCIPYAIIHRSGLNTSCCLWDTVVPAKLERLREHVKHI